LSYQSDALASDHCQIVTVKKRVRRWAWIPKVRRVHGHRIFIRRRGKIVYVHARVWRTRTAVSVVCGSSSALAVPPAPQSPIVPPPLLAAEPGAPPSESGSPLQRPFNTAAPTISGTTQQGRLLTASQGTWSSSPTSYSYQWLRCDSAGASCAPLALATTSSYGVVEADVGHTLRVTVVAANAVGSSAPASSAHTEVVTAEPRVPTNTSPPTITGTAQQGETLTASPGSWTGSPTEYSYLWKRCGAAGGSCKTIEGALAPTYLLTEADVGRTLRVSVVASNSAGSSAPATSAPTPVVTGTGAVHHLEYVVQDGATSVYDMDHEFTLVKTISLPLTSDEVRGVSVAPSKHTMYIMHGGDGPNNGSGNGSVLAYDLVSEKVIWNVKLNTGIDSGQVSPDAEKLYIPTGESTASGIWNVLSTANGEVIGTIQGPSGAHNTVASTDGRYVYLGGRASNTLDAYETATAKAKQIGPLIGTERPFTVNGSNTLAFTTATNFDGFQISSVATGKVLFSVSLGEIPTGFPFTTASHGIALSPDERQVYVLDAVNKVVQLWDVSRVKEGVAPTQIGVVPVTGLSGNESLCVYDCGREGWLQLSLDGRYLFVGDSGEVIDTATREVITTLATLAETKKSIEVDWQNGVPIATSGRTGVGYVP
jgi:hypothetical protein